MSDRTAKRVIRVILFVLGLYKLFYIIALAAIIACVCSPFGSEWFYVFLVTVVQFGLIGYGCQLSYQRFRFIEEVLGDE